MTKYEKESIQQLVERVHLLMEGYFDALERSIHSSNYKFQNREEDARLFHTLAQTLIRLTELEKLVKPPKEESQDDEAIQQRLEQRLFKVIKPKSAKNLPQ